MTPTVLDDRALVIPQGLRCGYGRNVVGKTEAAIALQPGGVSLLVGLNGAGKTTLMKTLCGVLPPIGDVEGRFPLPAACYLPEELDFPPQLTPRQMQKCFLTESDKDLAQWSIDFKHRMGITLDKEFRALSKGNRQKVRVWLTELLGQQRNAELICLDEPLTGLDFAARDALLAFWESARGGKAHRLISLHPTELPKSVDQIIAVKDGRIYALPGTYSWDKLREELGT